MEATPNIWLIPVDGELLPAILSIHGAGDDDAALHALGGYAHETEDAWALLPDDAWAVFAYTVGMLSVEVFSAHAQGAILTRRLPLLPAGYEDLAAGVLVFTTPEPATLAEFQAMLERGEVEEPLSIGVKWGNYDKKSKSCYQGAATTNRGNLQH